MTKNDSQDFLLHVSFDLLVYDHNDIPSVNPDLETFIDSIGISIDFKALDEYYFDQKVGKGDVYVYTFSEKEFLVFDLYKGKDDQCDIITIGARISSKNIYHGMNAIRSLYDHAQFMVKYQQAWKLNELDDLVKKSSYPKDLLGYQKNIHFNSMKFKKNA